MDTSVEDHERTAPSGVTQAGTAGQESAGGGEAAAEGMGSETTVQAVLSDLLRYEEVLGAVAVSVDGLVIGAAGVEEEDAEFLSVLGSSLVGVAERSTRRIGAGSALGMSILASDGMVTVRNGGSFALTVLSEQVDSTRLTIVTQPALARIATILDGI